MTQTFPGTIFIFTQEKELTSGQYNNAVFSKFTIDLP
jgi:hypothetical protein